MCTSRYGRCGHTDDYDDGRCLWVPSVMGNLCGAAEPKYGIDFMELSIVVGVDIDLFYCILQKKDEKI